MKWRLAGWLLLVAVLVAVMAVALRGVEIHGLPDPDVIDPFKHLAVAAKPPQRVKIPGPQEPPPPRSVRVAVTSMDGTPIPGARVELVPGPADGEQRGFIPNAVAPPHGRRVAADEAGSATVDDVPPGRWFVVAEAPGFARHALPGVVRDGDAAVDTTVALEKGHAFAGIVRDQDGAPATGVTVIIRPRTAFVSDATCLRTTTSTDGSYRFESVEDGEQCVWYAPHPDVCVLEALALVPQLDGLDIRMVRGAAIEGTVRDADTGGPIAGAKVVALEYVDSGISGVAGVTNVLDRGSTDRLGRFTLHTWRRQCGLTSFAVDADGYAPFPVEDSGTCPSAPIADGQRFAFDLRVRRSGSLVGTVTAPGESVDGLRVFARPGDAGISSSPGARPWMCPVGADGRYRIDGLPAGPAKVFLPDRDTNWPLAPEVDVEIASGHETTLNVEVPTRRVHIARVIVDEKGTPLRDVEVASRLGRFRAVARTDAQGRFELDTVPPVDDLIRLVVHRPGFGACDVLVSSEDEPIRLPAGRVEVRGTLARADGVPAAGVRFELVAGVIGVEDSFADWYGTRETVTARDGTFRLPLTGGPGHWIVATNLVGFESPGDIERDMGEEPFELEAPATSRCAGSIVDASGKPVAGARVVAFDSIVVARTGADGRFDVTLPSSFVESLSVRADGCLRASVPSGTDDPRVEVSRALCVSGTVRRADGTPLPNLRVTVRRPDSAAEYPPWDGSSSTDHDGRFVVPDLPAGSYEVSVVDPVHQTIAGRRVAAAAGGPNVEVTIGTAVRVVIHVNDAGGQPLAAAEVTAHPASPDLADVTERTHPDGEVEFGLAAGVTYSILVKREGYAPAERPEVRAADGDVTISLTAADDR